MSGAEECRSYRTFKQPEGSTHESSQFALAPVYDMLPMRYAPEHDEMPARSFVPPAPSADSLKEFGRARALAEKYWAACASDARISAEFRAVAAGNLRSIEALPRAGAFTA